MNLKQVKDVIPRHPVIRVFIVIAFMLIAYVIYGLISFGNELKQTQGEFSITREGLETRITELENKLLATETGLTDALKAAQEQSDSLADELEDIDDTVGDLEKLSQTDKELLQKYSKVYFLNEHYVPTDLRDVPSKLRSDPLKPMKVHREVLTYLEDLLAEAKDDNIDLRVLSGFRSFTEQAGLKSAYSVTYGAGTANQFSADQGYSEHQLGTAVDLNTPAMGQSLDGFAATEAYKWLTANAYKYGFILSYPANNAYYVFEPWHWRFVGTDLARYLNKNKLNFYDADQRKINEYLLNIFD